MDMVIKNCEVFFPTYFGIKSKDDKFAVIQCNIYGTDVFDSLLSKYKILFGSKEQSDDYDVIIDIIYADESKNKPVNALMDFRDNHGHKYFIIKNSPNLSDAELSTLCEHGLHNGLFDHCLDEFIENYVVYTIDEEEFKEKFQTIAPNKYLFVGKVKENPKKV